MPPSSPPGVRLCGGSRALCRGSGCRGPHGEAPHTKLNEKAALRRTSILHRTGSHGCVAEAADHSSHTFWFAGCRSRSAISTGSTKMAAPSRQQRWGSASASLGLSAHKTMDTACLTASPSRGAGVGSDAQNAAAAAARRPLSHCAPHPPLGRAGRLAQAGAGWGLGAGWAGV